MVLTQYRPSGTFRLGVPYMYNKKHAEFSSKLQHFQEIMDNIYKILDKF